MTITGRVTFRGLTLGTGTPYGITAVEGWEDLPDLSDDSEAYPYSDGETLGLLRAAGRTVTITGHLFDVGQAAGLAVALASATYKSRELDTLTVEQYGRTLTAQARVIRRALPQDLGYGRGWQTWSLQLRCPDPRRYLPSAGNVSTGLPTLSGGIALPVNLPTRLGVATSSGTIFLPNTGDSSYRPVLTVTGPLPNGHTVRDVATGRLLRYEGTLAAGQVLTYDNGRRRATLTGGTDARGWLTSAQWLEVPGTSPGAPGGMSLAFASLGTDGDPAARLAAVAPPAGALL